VFFTSLIGGFAAGTLGGLLGLGGGVILVPLLSEVFHLEQKKAHATSLSIIFFTGLTGALSYLRYGSLPLMAAVWTGIGALLTCGPGVLLADRIRETRLRGIFGLFLVLVSFSMFYGVIRQYTVHEPSAFHLPSPWVLLLLGAFTGFLSSFLGVGGGSIDVPVFVLILHFAQRMAQGIALVVMVPRTLVASLINLRLGNIRLDLIPGFVLGVLGGAPTGAWIAHRIPNPYLTRLFAVALFFLGVRYLRELRTR